MMKIQFIPVGKAKNLTGKRFGRLVVLGRVAPPNKNDRKSYWWCHCDCGNELTIRGDQLTRGICSSCGCYKKQVNQQQGKVLAKKYNNINGRNNKKDLTNQKFGHLIVLKDSNKRLQTGSGTNVIWICQCDCGKIIEIPGGKLQSGHTSSCGCRKMSKGEEKIYQLLKTANIPFKQEYIFKQEKLSTGGYPRFDFFVNNSYVIEYDGEQHFNYTNNGWNNKEQFLLTQMRDKEKNDLCKKYNIPIIRIPYTHLKNITLKDLLLTTSKFLI